MRIGLGMALALMASPAMAANQFDLSCKTISSSGYDKSPPPSEVKLTIDLLRMEYCENGCSNILKIKSVMTDKIILRSYRDSGQGLIIDISAVVDRVLGVYQYEFSQIYPYPSTKAYTADCELKPFSGFPIAKF